MTNSYNGIPITAKMGTDFNTQYETGDMGLTQNTTLSKNPLYNLIQVLFNGTKSENVPQHSTADIFRSNGLKENFVPEGEQGSKLNLIG